MGFRLMRLKLHWTCLLLGPLTKTKTRREMDSGKVSGRSSLVDAFHERRACGRNFESARANPASWSMWREYKGNMTTNSVSDRFARWLMDCQDVTHTLEGDVCPLGCPLVGADMPGVGEEVVSLDMNGKADSALEWLLAGSNWGATGVPR